MVTAGNEVDPLVTYLAAVSGGHVVLFVADDANTGRGDALVAAFDPDVVVSGPSRGWVMTERREGSRHVLHPDLALLGSTSGSTGSPKLVRLSFDNLLSNAQAIAEYLRLSPGDRAATTLPLQYCYGLSVVNSHLVSGASLLLTKRSVTEEAFWSEFAAAGATSFAGVPYTFELLDASGFADRRLPSLRYVTQAGGRLAPDAVRHHADLARRRGYEFFVMYGQTEATARMAYVPPELAGSAAGAIGRPIPGGTLRVDADPGADTGELVYRGPNVMMGYAQSPQDLAQGHTLEELRTGDVGRVRPDGLFEIVGRMNRFAKLYGVRVDLDHLERLLAADGMDARVVSDEDRRLLVFVRAERLVPAAVAAVAAAASVPAHAVTGFAVAEFPRTESGKSDAVALRAYAAALSDVPAPAPQGGGDDGRADTLRHVYARLLARPDATVEDSFTSLDGDSLSFVELSVRLEETLGDLPPEWPSMSIRELNDLGTTPPVPGHAVSRRSSRWRSWPRMETATVLRAIAIVLIVGTHADLFFVRGGAHLLLIVFGFGIARFQLADAPGAVRSRRLLRSAARIAVPAVVWIGLVAVLTGQYGWSTVLLVHGFVPDDGRWDRQWEYWFIEAAVWLLVLLAVLFAFRGVVRWERARPFAFAMALLVAALLLRYAVTGVEAGLVERYTLPASAWLVFLGWAAARADRWWQRAALSVMVVGGMIGFLGDPVREAVVVAGALVLLWIPAVRLPRGVTPVLVLVAGSSLFVYLTHWTVFPAWESTSPLLGVLLSFAVGFAAWRLYQFVETRLPGRGSRLTRPASVPGTGSRPRRPEPASSPQRGTRESRAAEPAG